MKILILSDTHFLNTDSLKAGGMSQNDLENFAFFPEILREKIKEADLIVHAGDFESEDAYNLFAKTGKLKAVYGNRDEKALTKRLPEKLIFEQSGLKFGVIHAAGRSLNDNTARWYMLEEMGVDVLIYGHIHTPSIDEYKGKFLICPGSPTKARMSEPSVAEIILDEAQKKIADIKIIPVAPASCGYLKFEEELVG
ncbi:MAG: metallophosphoesterase, partial [Methanimicrococcus sp.]|nr:metallophosphoesterase [Methanimicrococcus sp.]